MAKRLTEEDIRLNIIVNGNKAQKEVYELEQANKKLKLETKEMQKELTKIGRSGRGAGKLSKEYKELEARIKANNATLQQNNARIKELTSSMKVTEMTMAQLKKRAAILRQALTRMVDGADMRKFQSELSEVNARMAVLNQRARAQGLSWGSAANWLNRYQTMLVGFAATLTGITYTMQRWLDYSGKLADQQANVRKTTGMTREEVEALTRALQDLDTRTSKMELLEIATEGGRMGIPIEEIAEFTEAMNKANISLGDTFTGGAGEVAAVLGKLKFLFKETKELGIEDAYDSIGSAINELGKNGIATERNIAEFAKRAGSMAEQLKPTVTEALALGATFEESGIEAEKASRAYNIFLRQATTKTKDFAEVMGKSVEEVEDMINADPTAFFLDFAEHLREINLKGTDMGKVLNKIGMNADAANKILGAASNNTDRFRRNIALANAAFADATSVTEEYNIKNKNLQATLLRLQRRIIGIFSDESVMHWMESVITWIAKFIGAEEDAEGVTKNWRNGLILLAKVIAMLVTSIISYNAAQKLHLLWTTRATAGSALWTLQQKLLTAQLNLNILATGLARAATALFTRGVKAATAEIRIMNTALKMNPWGVFATAIGLAISAMVLFRKETKKAVNAQKLLNSVSKEAASNIKAEKTQLEALYKVAKDETLQKSYRLQALEKLNEIMPGYNDLLNLEKINTMEAAAAVKQHTAELLKNAKVKAIQAKINDLERQKLDARQGPASDFQSGWQKFWTGFGDPFGRKTKYDSAGDLVADLRKKFPTLDADSFAELARQEMEWAGFTARDAFINEAVRQQEILAKELQSLYAEGIFGDFGDGDQEDFDFGGDDKDKKSANREAERLKRERDRRIQELKRENERLSNDLLKIQREYQDDRLSLQDEGFEKELEKLQLQHERRIEDLRRQIVDDSDIQMLEDERTKAMQDGDTERAELLDELIGNTLLKNEELHNIILQEELVFQQKIGKLQADFGKRRLEQIQKDYETAKKERERRWDEELVELGTVEAIKERLRDSLSARELAQIKTWNDAKRALRRQQQAEEIDLEIEHLENLIDEMQTALETGFIDEFSLELLTEEEKEALLSRIDDVKAKLVELGIAKADLMNENAGGDMGGYGMGGGLDIFGMTPENWQAFIENIQNGKYELDEMIATVGLLSNAFSAYFDMVQAGERRNLDLFNRSVDQKKAKYKKDLDNRVISQERYDKLVERLEETAEKRRQQMEYEGAMRQWKMNIAKATADTAMVILNAAKTQPFLPTGLAMVGLATSMGALQLGAIMKSKPVKGFEDGLYPVQREQDGKMFNARWGGASGSGMVTRPTLFLAGEHNKPEMIIDNQAYRQFPSDLKYRLHAEIARAKGFEDGYYPGSDGKLEEIMMRMSAQMEVNNALLQQMAETYGYTELVMDFEAMRKFKKAEDDFNRHKNKNKI